MALNFAARASVLFLIFCLLKPNWQKSVMVWLALRAAHERIGAGRAGAFCENALALILA